MEYQIIQTLEQSQRLAQRKKKEKNQKTTTEKPNRRGSREFQLSLSFLEAAEFRRGRKYKRLPTWLMVNEGQMTCSTDTVAVLVLLFHRNSWNTAQGVENCCCDDVTQNCVQINWNARTSPKKWRNHGSQEDCGTFPLTSKQPPSLELRLDGCVLVLILVYLFFEVWATSGTQKKGVHLTFSFFLCSAIHWISIILQVREVQLTAPTSSLSAPAHHIAYRKRQ